MQSLSYWKQFESTGKIEDYLSYSSVPFRDADSSFLAMEAGRNFRENTLKNLANSENVERMEDMGQLVGSESL